MRNKAIAILIFFVFVLVVVLTILRTLPPSPLPVNAPASEFSAERALRHIQIIAQEPHPTGSPANAAVRNYIIQELNNLGLETETQNSGILENVVARIKGTSSSDAVLLTAHLDSVAESFGATDDGSGVAVLLETARALKSGSPSINTVMFLFSDAEEQGAVGAKVFIANHPWAKDVKIVIGFDAGGLSGPGVLSTTSSRNGWLIHHLTRADSSIVGGSAINALTSSGTDFGLAFKQAGFSGYAFDLYWDPRIHSADDNVENINLSSIQHQGFHALSLARHLGSVTPLSDPRESNAIYFNVLRLFNISYSPIWAILLAMAITVVFIGVLNWGFRRTIFTWRGIEYGAVVLLVGLMIASWPNLLLEKFVPPWTSSGQSLGQPLPVGLIVLIMLVLIMLWYYLSRRVFQINLVDLAMGALLPLVIIMVAASIAFPALSYLVAWPLLFNLLAIGNFFYWYLRRKNSKLAITGLVISGAVAIIVIGPTLLLGLFDQRSLALVLLGVLCGFLAPNIYLMLSDDQGRNPEPIHNPIDQN